jgi:hypothetical protein
MNHTCPWVIVYWVFILEHSWNILNKIIFFNLEKFWDFSSHYSIMVYIKNLLKMSLKKIQIHFKVLLLFKSTSYIVLTMTKFDFMVNH